MMMRQDVIFLSELQKRAEYLSNSLTNMADDFRRRVDNIHERFPDGNQISESLTGQADELEDIRDQLIDITNRIGGLIE